MQLKWTGVIVAALISGLLAACGGGGGGQPGDGATPSNDANGGNGTALSTTRHYGDEWQRSYTRTLQGSSDSKTFVRGFKVEAVNPAGGYSLSIRTPAVDGAPDAVSTEQYDAYNNQISQGQCVGAPSSVPQRAVFTKGEQWTNTAPVSCLNDDTVQSTWSVMDVLTVKKAGVTFHAYQLHRESTTYAASADGMLQDPSLPSKVVATCLLAPEIGMYITCDTAYTYAQTPAAGTTLTESFDLTSFKPSNATTKPPVPPSSVYPAVQAALPQVSQSALQAQAEVLPAPLLVPVFYRNTPTPDQKSAYLKRLLASPSWAVLREYGVGAGQWPDTLPPIQGDAPAALMDSDIQAMLASNLTSGAIKTDPNNFLVVFLPSSTTVTTSAGSKSCAGFHAYHSAFRTTSGSRVAYAVVPDCRRGTGALSVATSHEVLEGVVDPYQTGYRAVSGDVSWAAAFKGAEIGDMCEHNIDLSAREEIKSDGTSYQGYAARIWSNLAARAGHNPCVPQRTFIQSDVYVNAMPQLEDAVRLTHSGSVGVARGVVIAPGQSKAIKVTLFSDGPTYGEWSVHATWLKRGDDDPSDPMTFTWDRTSGQNGDVLTLTITAPKAPMPNGGLFVIESHYNGTTATWTGAVGNEAATTVATVIAGSTKQGLAMDGAGAAAEFGEGGRIAMAADGNSLLVANLNVLRKVGLDGKVMTLSGGGLLANQEALTLYGGTVYVAGERDVMAPGSNSISWNRYVQRINSGGVATTLNGISGSDAVFGGKAGTGGMAMGPDGHLYVAAPALNQILVIDPRTGASAVYAGRSDAVAGAEEGELSGASFNHPMGLSFDADGNLYVCDAGNRKIRKISADGLVSTLAGSGQINHANGQGASAGFTFPSDVAFDALSGRLYVADNDTIRQIGLDGSVRTVIGGDLGYGFYGLTLDTRGVLFATTVGGMAGVVRVSGMN